MVRRPSGVVSFLFSDVQGSTRLWEENRDGAARLMADHDRILREAIASHGGVVLSTAGDSFDAAFHTPLDAVQAGLAAQLAIGGRLAMRMAVHMGQVDSRADGQYAGPALYRCGRLRDAAHGGQFVCSQAVAGVVADVLDGADLVDLGEHRLRDLDRPERIFQISHPELPSDFPPLLTLTADKTNLPIESTSFVGRDQDMNETRTLIRSARLLTLTGPGGSGKSRLAVELAATLLDEFPDGVWLAELASTSQPDLVVNSVASTFHVAEQTGHTLTETLIAHLKNRTLLLIIDNCEHVLEPAGALASAITGGTLDVRVIATSQAPLHIHGETVYTVPPLAQPPLDADPGAVVDSPAARLFLDRTAAVKPGFRLTADNSRTVASICRHLDGIPLAIELAAAATRLLPVSEIERHLDDRFRLLRHGSADHRPHHRTLETATAWSFDLLEPAQQVLFGRLAVFQGGWTVEAAEHVCVGEPLTREDVLPVLTDLIDRSLVEVVEGGLETRFRYLDTIHAFADSQGIEPESAHASYFVSLAEELASLLFSSDMPLLNARFTADLPNFRLALDELDEQGRAADYCRLVVAMAPLWRNSEHGYSEAEGRLQRALDLAPPDLDPGLRGLLYLHAGRNATGPAVVGPGGRRTRANRFLEKALPLLSEAGDHRHLADALFALVLNGARSYQDQALEAAARSGDPTAVADAHYVLGMTRFLDGDFSSAQRQFDQALEQSPIPRWSIMFMKAAALAYDGSLHKALELANSMLPNREEVEDEIGVLGTLELRAQILMDMSQTALALEDLGRQIDIQRNLFGKERPGPHADAFFAHVQLRNPQQALHHLFDLRQSGAEVGDELTLGQQLDRVYLGLALLALQQGEPQMGAVALGGQSVHRAGMNLPVGKPRSELTDRIIDNVRSSLAPGQFDDAWKYGTTLTLDDLIGLALDEYGNPQAISDATARASSAET